MVIWKLVYQLLIDGYKLCLKVGVISPLQLKRLFQFIANIGCLLNKLIGAIIKNKLLGE